MMTALIRKFPGGGLEPMELRADNEPLAVSPEESVASEKITTTTASFTCPNSCLYVYPARVTYVNGNNLVLVWPDDSIEVGDRVSLTDIQHGPGQPRPWLKHRMTTDFQLQASGIPITKGDNVRSPQNNVLTALIVILLGGALVPMGLHAENDPRAVSPEESVASEKISTSTASFVCTDRYCTYTGQVRMTYINDGDLLLIYPDASLSPTDIRNEIQASLYEETYGVEVTSFSAFGLAHPTTEQGRSYADKLFKLALASELARRTITLQMRGGSAGPFLRVDRAWLK